LRQPRNIARIARIYHCFRGRLRPRQRIHELLIPFQPAMAHIRARSATNVGVKTWSLSTLCVRVFRPFPSRSRHCLRIRKLGESICSLAVSARSERISSRNTIVTASRIEVNAPTLRRCDTEDINDEETATMLILKWYSMNSPVESHLRALVSVLAWTSWLLCD
jgi:hypothetical protein